jgi:hypothetical protein
MPKSPLLLWVALENALGGDVGLESLQTKLQTNCAIQGRHRTSQGRTIKRKMANKHATATAGPIVP